MIVDLPYYHFSSSEKARNQSVKPHIIQSENVIIPLKRDQNKNQVIFLLQANADSQREEQRITIEHVLSSSLEDGWYWAAGGSSQLCFEKESLELISESFNSRICLFKDTYFCEDGENSVHTVIYHFVIFLIE